MKHLFFINCFFYCFIVFSAFAQNHNVDKVSVKKQQLQIWLKKLEALKGSKKETPILNITSKILNQDPNNLYALNTLGVFYLQSEKLYIAKIIFTRALKKHPKNYSLINNLAVIALKEDKTQEAINGFRESLQYNNNYAAAANLGTLYIQAYENKYALGHLNMAYNKIQKELPITHNKVIRVGNNYAVSLAWAGKFKQAEDVFHKLVKINPTQIELLVNYAILLGVNLKNKRKAHYFLQKADFLNQYGKHTRKIKAIKSIL